MNNESTASANMPEFPREIYEPVLAHHIEIEGYLKQELTLSYVDLDGSHELKTCYGDILKTINALMDYVLTVNLDSVRPQNCAFIDTNNNGEEILAWIIRHGLAVPTGTYARSGYCQYPEYRFRPEILQEIDPKGYCTYLHDWKERYGT